MSAIWGAIDFSGKEIEEKTKETLRDGFKKCAIDKVSEISSGNVYIACGLQYFTPESRHEILPCGDKNVFFTADAYLDNRDEMCSKLGIPNAPDMGDGEIIRRCYEKFGDKCLNDLLGAYTFVRIDSSLKRVDIVTDAVGNRFVYYFCEDNIFYFSSLMTPLEALKKEIKLNKEWVAFYFAVDTLDTFVDTESTMTEGIYRVAPATHFRIDNGSEITKDLYWDLTKIKRTKKPKTDAEYRREFRALYKRCVADTMRTDEEVSIFLSGGYDSTSVACLAAPVLKERGRKLYSYTSVPLKDFEFEGNGHNEANEFDSVKKNVEFLGNVECESIDLADVDLWDIRKEYDEVVELPYKSPENMIWLYEGFRLAGQKGARLILSGAFGNGTVSYNNLRQYLMWLVSHGKFLKYREELNSFQRRLGASRKHIIKSTFEGFVKATLPKKINFDRYKDTYAIQSYVESTGVVERLRRDEESVKKNYMKAQGHHESFLPPINFRHYGEFSFKNSIRTGVLFRDPTRDKRMIEFVKSVPYDQFTHNGYTRRLIREYLEDLMPPEYFVMHPIGVQSADMKFRFTKLEARHKDEWKEIVASADSLGVIDKEKLLKDLNNKAIGELGNGELMRLFYSINALEYMQKYKM